jgi:hypothetical protein
LLMDTNQLEKCYHQPNEIIREVQNKQKNPI